MLVTIHPRPGFLFMKTMEVNIPKDVDTCCKPSHSSGADCIVQNLRWVEKGKVCHAESEASLEQIDHCDSGVNTRLIVGSNTKYYISN